MTSDIFSEGREGRGVDHPSRSANECLYVERRRKSHWLIHMTLEEDMHTNNGNQSV